jgi:hypothetical protein
LKRGIASLCLGRGKGKTLPIERPGADLKVGPYARPILRDADPDSSVEHDS